MNSAPFRTFLFLLFLLGAELSFANAPKVGKTAAAKYFQKNGDAAGAAAERFVASASESISGDERFLALGISSYVKSEAYQWGSSNREDMVGKLGVDLSYRLSTYNNLLDYALRVSYNQYEPAAQKATKLSVLYAVTFPDAGSHFPLYFGAAAGAGVFFSQLSGESPVSADYQLFLGFRLFNLFEKMGMYVEGGLKNHVQLTSDGQLNGTYLGGGAIFTF